MATKKSRAQKQAEKQMFSAIKRIPLLAKIIFMLVVGALLASSVIFFEDNIHAAFGWQGKINAQDISGDASAENIAAINAGELIIHYIDVGQGDSILIEFPQGDEARPTLMLIDGAKYSERDKVTAYLDETFPDLIDDDFYFEYIINTHPDDDHCGGLAEVISKYGAKYIYRPNIATAYNGFRDPAKTANGRNALRGNYSSKDTKRYHDFIAAAYNSNIEGSEVIVSVNPTKDYADELQKFIKYDADKNGSFDDDVDVLFKFWSPLSDNYKDWNDYSPIMTLDYLGKRALFTGDAEKAAEKEFATQYSKESFGISCDIVKFGHHGSRTSTSEGLLNIVTESSLRGNVIGIVSCGLNNSYKHPHSEVLSRWSNLGFKMENLLRTDTMSTIVLSLKFDADENEAVIMFGTTKIRSLEPEPMRWLYIAVAIFAVLFVLVFILGTDWSGKSNTKKKKRK